MFLLGRLIAVDSDNAQVQARAGAASAAAVEAAAGV